MKLYVHVPFCRSKCAYCDFYSTPRRQLADAWADAVGHEWRRLSHGCVPGTLYLGGGTPSSLTLPQLDRVMGHLQLTAPLDECTIEANPDDITPEWAAHIAACTPFGRVSMGIQTFDDATLALLGRHHTGSGAVKAMETLRNAGIGNISCDLIYGLPGQSLEHWQRDVQRLISLRPQHISAYLLTYEPRTRLGVMLRKGLVQEADDALAQQMYLELCRLTALAGYEHYEISNFALPGYRARHNSAYWDGSDYLGLGPGAHSMVHGQRWHNPSDLVQYVRRAPLQDVRVMDPEDDVNRHNDLVITALRTARGLDPGRVNPTVAPHFDRTAQRLLDSGALLTAPGGNLVIPEERWLTADAVIIELMEDPG